VYNRGIDQSFRKLATPKSTWLVTADYFGKRVFVLQEPLNKRGGKDDADTTGRIVWQCGHVMLKWLERYGFSRLTGKDDNDDALVSRASLCGVDLSAGAGLIALALVAAGIGRVGATETGAQLRHLRDNVSEVTTSGGGGKGGIIQTADIAWGIETGDFIEKCNSFGDINFFISSDILYIALRDGLGDALRATLIDAASCVGSGGAIFFGFEERLHREEEEWLESLKNVGHLDCEEIPKNETVLTQSEMLKNAGGPPQTHEDDEDDGGGGGGGLGCLFWQPPDLRFFFIRSKKI
jgi:hypothetical protein